MSTFPGHDQPRMPAAPDPLELPLDLRANVARARLRHVAARAVYVGPALKPWSRTYARAIAAQPAFQPDTWPGLTLPERRQAIQDLENIIAAAQQREPATITSLPDSAPTTTLRRAGEFVLETGRWLLDGPRRLAGLPSLAREDIDKVGLFDPTDNTISLSESELGDDSPVPVLDTFAHEDRHALQEGARDAPRRWTVNNKHYISSWDHGPHALALTTLGAVTSAFLAPALALPLAIAGAAIAVVNAASNAAYRYQPVERNAYIVGDTVTSTIAPAFDRALT